MGASLSTGSSGTGDGDSLTDDTIAAADSRGAREPASVAPGDKLGRYIILEPLGRGGMGSVFAAYDPQLDRKIAIKILHREQADAKAVLIAEAQAMARLRHPHVVSVHDVGEHRGELFLAMEFVEGDTLRRWLRSGRREQRDVLRVFDEAGRGLAAAHAAGIVHRDFKPDNVMVTSDGASARVMDFGIAMRLEPDGGTDPSGLHGVSVGTPAYMAPEQHGGVAPDARSDQFGFCVALYEALYGERPFKGKTAPEIAYQILHTDPRPPPGSKDVPSRIQAGVLRGLSRKPEDRHESMDALVRHLTATPKRRRQWVVGSGVVAGVTAIGLWVAARDDVCKFGQESVAEAWDHRAQKEARAGLLDTGRNHASGTWVRVQAATDRWVEEWITARRDACEATEVRHEQSEHLLDLRMRCLDRQLAALSAFTELLATADAEVADAAIQAALGLPPPSDCGDIEALMEVVPAPMHSPEREHAERAHATLAEAYARSQAGRYAESASTAERALAEATLSEHAPTRGDALLALGIAQRRAGNPQAAETSLLEALEAAERGRHRVAAAEAMVELVGVIGSDQARHAEGELLARLARASLLSVPSPDLPGQTARQALLAENLGTVLVGGGRLQDARESLRHALELHGRARGDEHPASARTLLALADVNIRLAEYDRATPQYERALEILEATLGTEHPEVGRAYNVAGNAAFKAARFAAALARYRRALEIRRRSLGDMHPDVAATLNNTGGALQKLGRHEDSLEAHHEALRIRRQVYGDRHPKVAMSLSNIGIVHHSAKNYEAAEKGFQEALSIRQGTLGADHPSTAEAMGNMVGLELSRERYDEAGKWATRAIGAFTQSLGPDHPDTLSATVLLGNVELKDGRPKQAAEHFESVLPALRKALGSEHPSVQQAEQMLALSRDADAPR